MQAWYAKLSSQAGLSRKPCMLHLSIAQHSIAWHSTAWHSIARHSTAWYNKAQYLTHDDSRDVHLASPCCLFLLPMHKLLPGLETMLKGVAIPQSSGPPQLQPSSPCQAYNTMLSLQPHSARTSCCSSPRLAVRVTSVGPTSMTDM